MVGQESFSEAKPCDTRGSVSISKLTLDNFCGLPLNPAFSECRVEGQDEDLYSSFSVSGIPLSPESHRPIDDTIVHHVESLDSITSLKAHYTRLCNLVDIRVNDLSALSSLRSHYVRLPNPGKSFSSLEHLEHKFKQLLRTSKHLGCRH